MIQDLPQPSIGEPGGCAHLNEAQLVFLRHTLVRLLGAETDVGGRAHEPGRPRCGRDQLGLAQALRDALGKLEQKVYGRCERCRGPIPYARLKVVPYARCCAACEHGRI